MVIGEDKIVQILDSLQEKGRYVPSTVAEIPRLPFDSFPALSKAFELNEVRMQRFAYAMDSAIFGFFATPFERIRLSIYSASMFIFPIVAIALGYFVSWWCLLLVLLIPVAMRTAKKLYNKVIFRAAFSSEKIFCFLYFARQISVVTGDYQTSYFWTEDSRNSKGDESILRNARADSFVPSNALSKIVHQSGTPDNFLPIVNGEERPLRHQEENRTASPSGIDADGIAQAIVNLVQQDVADIASGKAVERRLIPHHAIKRDIILRAFANDFLKMSRSMQYLNRQHYEDQIAEIKQWSVDELDRMLNIMVRERTDLVELERQVRSERSLYSMVAPLFETSTSDAPKTPS